MDLITKNTGLQHISEEIFLNLDHKSLLKCFEVNTFWKEILINPMFWLKKCVSKGINKQDELEWAKLIQTLKKTSEKVLVMSFLMQIHKGIPSKMKNPLYMARKQKNFQLMEHILHFKIPCDTKITTTP